MPVKYNAAIIGCGNIAALYDQPHHSDRVLTHAHAYTLEPRINLCALADVDRQRAIDAAGKWGGTPYNDARKMLEKEDIDIISICVPDEYHESILDLCYLYNPKAVFCEKPLTKNTDSANRIVKEYEDAGIHLAVNFTRRWDQAVQELKKEIMQDKYGRVLNVSCIYTKGILHNGSHLIDLLRFLFGDVADAAVLSGRYDWDETDPTLDAFIRFSNGAQAHIMGADARCYTLFEIDILFEKARIYFDRSGFQMTVYKIEENPIYSGYLDIVEKQCIQTGLNRAISCAVSNIIDAIEGKDKLICSGKDAVIAQETCLKLIHEYQKLGA